MKNNLRRDKSEPSKAKGFGEWKIASPWVRASAQVIDQGLVSFAVISAMALWFPQNMGSVKWYAALILLWIFVSTLTQALFTWFYGNTPGKKSMGLVLQSASPQGGDIGLAQIIVRSFTWWLSAFTFGSGWSTIFSRTDRRAWHDVAADTVVVSQESEPSRPTLFQKQMGDLWVTVLACFFGFFVVIMLLLQLQNLRRLGGPVSFEKINSRSLWDQQTWNLVAGIPLRPDNSLVGVDAKFSQSLSLFSKARLMPLGERFNFYKVNMEPLEDEICRFGFEKTPSCQSARLMVELLTPEPALSLYPKAYQGLRALQQIEALTKSTEQIRYIENELKKMPVFSPQYFAFKNFESKVFLKKGDLKLAAENVRADLESVAKTEFKDQTFMKAFVDSSCQVLALNDGKFEQASLCLKKPFWNAWQKGYSSLTVPSKDAAPAEALGYWWSQAQSSKLKDQKFSDWDSLKAQFDTKEMTIDGEFQRNVTVALDFVINFKLSPKDVLARERKMAPENPLWGWAQKQALQEFGSQWSFIIYPIERKLLEKYSVIAVKNNRAIASETSVEAKKPQLTPQLTIERQ